MAAIDDVETYSEGGVWKTRWLHSAQPFATGTRERQISQGATVAAWYGVDHIIRNPDGTIAEHNSYRYRRQHGVGQSSSAPSPSRQSRGG
jgi:hypothetical protein